MAARAASLEVENVLHLFALTPFFGEDDYALHRYACRANAASTVWRSTAYCLTPNHVHLILVHTRAETLR
jgi:hypothetical protein